MTKQLITKSLKLPFQFDEQRLLKDLEIALNRDWIPHFNKGGYEGEWNSIALYAKGGDEQNIVVFDHNEAPLVPTNIMNDCLYFKEVLAQFKCNFSSVRLLKLAVGANIKPHQDYKLGYEDGNFRLHIPITTNDQVDFVLDNNRLEMLPGQCWYTNVNYTHAVANNGTTDRVHLVFDGMRNTWSDELFFSLAPEESFFPVQEEVFDAATLKRMIEEFEQMDNPTVAELINKYKNQLESME